MRKGSEDIIGEFGYFNVYARRDYARGRDFGLVYLHATLGPDVAVDFWWVFA